jgi:hypothetical protein
MVIMRFKLRTLLLLVGLAAITVTATLETCRIVGMASRYREKAKLHAKLESIEVGLEAHWRRVQATASASYMRWHGREAAESQQLAGKRRDYHAALKQKYFEAARNPWRRVAPDPVEPH